MTEEQQKQLYEYNRMISTFAKMNLININYDDSSAVKSYTKEELMKMMKSLNKLETQQRLRNISRNLYAASSQYRSLINYYSTLFNFDYVVESNGAYVESPDVVKFKKAYMNAIKDIEKINIKQETISIRAKTYVDGVFYGYAIPSKDGFYIQHLDPDYCKISFINVETGLLGYSFNFSYFDSYPKYIDSFPDEFISIYREHKRNKRKGSNSNWIKIDSPNAICFKAVPSAKYAIPPMLGLFEGILDIADFKALSKGKEELENYKILFQQIPMKDDKDAETDEFLISPDFVQIFHDNIESTLPSQVGVITSPMPVTPITFDKDKVDSNKVTEATSQFWSESGAPELLFNNNSTSTALKYSVIADESFLMGFVLDFERWLNEYLKVTLKGTHKFKVRILDTTRFNISDKISSALNAAQYGVPNKMEICAMFGMSPSAVVNNAFLENEVLDLVNKFVPLSSSHTTSNSTNAGGRPTVDDEDLTDAGANNRENNVDAET